MRPKDPQVAARKEKREQWLRLQTLEKKRPKRESLESLVYHFVRQLWLVLGVKLMEISRNWFSRRCVFSGGGKCDSKGQKCQDNQRLFFFSWPQDVKT